MSPNSKTILVAISFPLAYIASLALFQLFPLTVPENMKWYFLGIVGTTLAIGINYIYLKFEKKTFLDIGLFWSRGTLRRFFVGWALGICIAVLMLAIIIIFSPLKVIRNEEAQITIVSCWMLAFIPLAFMEEVVFRGYSFIKLNRTIGLRWTQVIMAVLFAYYHDSTGASLPSQLLGPGIWAIIYGLAAIWSDGLALPTGLHAAANMVLASVGMKDEIFSIWYLDSNQNIDAVMQSQIGWISLLVQIALLIGGLIVMEWFIRKKKGRENEFYLGKL